MFQTVAFTPTHTLAAATQTTETIRDTALAEQSIPPQSNYNDFLTHLETNHHS